MPFCPFALKDVISIALQFPFMYDGSMPIYHGGNQYPRLYTGRFRGSFDYLVLSQRGILIHAVAAWACVPDTFSPVDTNRPARLVEVVFTGHVQHETKRLTGFL